MKIKFIDKILKILKHHAVIMNKVLNGGTEFVFPTGK